MWIRIRNTDKSKLSLTFLAKLAMLHAWSYFVSGSLSVKDQLADPIGGFFTKFPFPPLEAPPATLPLAAVPAPPPLTLVFAIFLSAKPNISNYGQPTQAK